MIVGQNSQFLLSYRFILINSSFCRIFPINWPDVFFQNCISAPDFKENIFENGIIHCFQYIIKAHFINLHLCRRSLQVCGRLLQACRRHFFSGKASADVQNGFASLRKASASLRKAFFFRGRLLQTCRRALQVCGRHLHVCKWRF